MTSTDRFERELPRLLNDLAEPQTPDYFDDLFWQTAHTSQRAGWTFLERWLPMLEIARRPVVAQMPWRPVAVLALIVLALVTSLVLAGAQRPLPPPFGPAGNGLIAISKDGDIYTYDPRTGLSRDIVSGPGFDVDPVWSRDGTRLVFRRMTAFDSTLFIARSDGSGLRELTPDGFPVIRSYDVSPDGGSVAIVADDLGIPSLFIAKGDGSGIRPIDTGSVVWGAAFRPTGSDILFVGPHGTDGSYGGLYLIDADGTNMRTLIEPRVDANIEGDASWSPDGTRIAYARWEPSVIQKDLRVHVMSADGTRDRIVGHAGGSWWESGPLNAADGPWSGAPLWSPDGTELLIERNPGTGDGEYSTHPSTPVVVSVDGGAPDVGIRFELSSRGSVAGWSPDGSMIQATPLDENGNTAQQLLWDPHTGESRVTPWAANSTPAWQRVAP
jgi:dipeptidyl aminopeptidase/acylaminoacyl peptidase